MSNKQQELEGDWSKLVDSPKLIYLASPYTKLNDVNREKCIIQIMQFISSRIENLDEVIYSPILHSHFMAEKMEMRVDWRYWINHNVTMLSRCDELWVWHFNGWKDSEGIEVEKRLAHELGLPIKHKIPPLEIK